MTQLLVFGAAWATTCASAPLLGWVYRRLGKLDMPNHRSSHTIPVPRAGGLACLFGTLAAAATASLLGFPVAWSTVLAIVALAAVGFIDDWRSLPPFPRLAAQVGIGFIFGWAQGNWWTAITGALLFPLVVNVVNFMDGINGLSGGVLTVWGIAALIVASTGAGAALSVVGATAVGIALGFLPWNVPRARLFLGDSGSYLIGSLISVGLLMGMLGSGSVVVLVAPLFLYLADVAFTLLKRTIQQAPLMEAHRDHTYQRLVAEMGMSHASVAAIMVATSFLLVATWLLFPMAAAISFSLLLVASFLFLPSLIDLRR